MALNEKQLELKLCEIGFELLQEENPVDASRSGFNTVFHYCDPLEIRASYAGCLHTLDAVAEGRGYLRPECEAEIAAGRCPAVAMRRQELLANRALFFVNYRLLLERRGIAWAETREELKFGRNRSPAQFTPTVTTSNVQPVERLAALVEAPVEIKTNIMEEVLKKRVANDK